MSQNIVSYYKKRIKRNKMIAEILTTGFWLAIGSGVVIVGLTIATAGFAIILEIFN